MARYIDAEPVEQAIQEIIDDYKRRSEIYCFSASHVCLRNIEQAPTADVAPVVHAHWEKDRDTIKCSNCGFGMFPTEVFFKDGVCISAHNTEYRPKSCPDCTALMDEKG